VPEPCVPPSHRVAVDVQANTLTTVRQPVLQPLDVQTTGDTERGVHVPQVVHANPREASFLAERLHQPAQRSSDALRCSTRTSS
jgi:hypothetical protein